MATCLAAVGGWRYARASAPVNGPIILISIDGIRADHLPPYGYADGRAPALAALAKDGILFERAYAHVPQTLPSHVTLLTGRLPFQTGVRDSVGFIVPQSERLLPEMLRDRGFATAGIVSSYLLRKESGIGQGFSFFDARLPKTALVTAETLRRDGMEAEQIAEQWLATSGTERAFLFLHLDEPRRPSTAASPFPELDTYDGAIAYADRIVGRLVRYLKSHQLYDRSTLIVVSDHGEGLGDHGEQEHGLFVYEESLRVPLIVKLPANEGSGRRVKTPVQLVDITPTVLELAKAPIPDNLSGRSLKPALDSGREDALRVRPVYSESLFGAYRFGWSALKSVALGRFRYIDAPREELYDLEADPQQRENLAAARASTVADLREQLSKFDGGARTPNPEEISLANREPYALLGYVGIPRALTVQTDAPVMDPKDSVDLLTRYRAAVLAAAAGDWDEATDGFQAAAGLEPTPSDAWNYLSRVAARAERHEVALEASRRALDAAPEDPAARLELASALLRARRLEEARKQASAVAELDDANKMIRAESHELLARIALARRDSETARAEAALAEEADPTKPVRAYVDGRVAFDQGRYDAAADSFGEALAAIREQKGEPLADLRLYAADTMLRLEQFDEAESLFLEELQDLPLSPHARAGLTAVYRATGRLDESASTAAQH